MGEEPADRDLVQRCLNGDVGAFESIVARYEKPVFNAAVRLVANNEDARDVAQTTFIKAFEKLSTYDGTHEFHTWIYRIAINEAINFRKRRHRLQSLSDPGVDMASDRRGPEDECSTHELSLHVQVALMSLKPDHRAVIVLRHYLESSYEEMAVILDVPDKTVKSRLFTARQQLKELLLHKGVTR